MNSSEQKRAAIPGRPKADYPSTVSGDPPGRDIQGQDEADRMPMFSRQRQPKGQILEEIHARVEPETAKWLRRLAGDSSIGLALDQLRRSILSR